MDGFNYSTHPHSELVDPALVAKVINTRIPLRVSKYRDVARDAELQISKEWYDLGGSDMWGGASPVGDIISFAIPNVQAEKLPAIIRLTEILFFIDDELEVLPADEVTGAAHEYLKPSTQVPESTPSKYLSQNESQSKKLRISDGKKQLLARILLEFYPFNRDHAQFIVDRLDKFADFNNAPRPVDDTLADFLRYRDVDAGCSTYCALLLLAYDLDLSRQDIEAVDYITFPACATMILCNDVYSYDKEVEQCVFTDKPHSNAVAYVMRERNIGVAEAKKVVLEEVIPPYEQEYLDKYHSYLANNKSGGKSAKVAKYLEEVGYILSGNWYWSTVCHRYHNQKQPRENPLASNQENGMTSASFPNGNIEAEAESPPEMVVSQIKREVNGTHSINGDLPLMHPTFHNDKIVQEPVNYIRSLPSKGLRGQAMRALNSWLRVPDSILQHIESAINYLHESSLMLDDIEDDSPLRRGKPATHVVYGLPQTINAANYLYVLALDAILELKNSACRKIYVDELRKLHIGQSYDLHWSQTGHCPTVPEYLEMVANKTGGLFCMLGRLMIGESSSASQISESEMSEFLKQLGQYYQIRDDYQNLTSVEYEAKKGFAEDLDEGKYSLPLIHALQNSPFHLRLQNILQQRFLKGAMTLEMKRIVLDMMEEAGSFRFTREYLASLEKVVDQFISRFESLTGEKNFVLRLIFERLKVA